uniref:Carbonic anhydrase n=1 Tax=Ditylenchus dipsaci TaxID=166011 RepID=A0A915EI32_9BILA
MDSCKELELQPERRFGPRNWPVLCRGRKGHLCELADQMPHQSPVDLQLSGEHTVECADKQGLKFVNYEELIVGDMVNTGHSVQFIPLKSLDPLKIHGGELDQHYQFLQYHYHWSQLDEHGSEHTLCGNHYPAELHLVHQGIDDPSKLAVLAIFLQLEQMESTALEVDAVVLPHIQHFNQKLVVYAHQLRSKLPNNVNSFVRYQGSLTTPPCSENVTWIVFTEPVAVSREQLNLLRSIKDCNDSIIYSNCRPLQN